MKTSDFATKQDNKTQISFTHIGLVPEYECFDVCKNACTDYLQNNTLQLVD